MYKLCLDAGHGGKDQGSTGPTKLLEKDVNLYVAKAVSALFNQKFSVFQTRDRDVTISLSERSSLANKNKADILVSIHCNSFTNKEASGVETYCYKMGGQGEKLARLIQKNMVAMTGLSDRGVKEKNLHMLRETKMPSALVELAFLSNPKEETLLKTEVFRKKCAQAIASAIKEYFGDTQVEKEISPARVFYKGREFEAFMVEGKVFAEVRELGIALGKKVLWNSTTKTTEILD